MSWLFGEKDSSCDVRAHEEIAKLDRVAAAFKESAEKGTRALQATACRREEEADASLGMRDMIGEVMRRIDGA